MWNLRRRRSIARDGASRDYGARLGAAGYCEGMPVVTEDVRFGRGPGWDWRDAAFEERTARV